MPRTAVLLTLLALTACKSLPPLSERDESRYIPTRSAPRLEAALQLPDNDGASAPAAASETGQPENPAARRQPETPPPRRTHGAPFLPGDPDAGSLPPDTSGDTEADSHPAHIRLLDRARDSLAARALLIDNAAVSLDIRYYIWRDDASGRLLMRKLWQAANRGVRVRLLLDDNNTRGMDSLLALLDSHPNIQVRLFNPFLYRKWRALGYLTDFPRLNRRMHNKTLTADNRAAIIGGRNISDEYFDIDGDTSYADMDVLAAGAVAEAVSQDFDRYWQSDSAYPFKSIVRHADPAQGLARLSESRREPERQRLADSLADTPFAREARSGTLRYTAAPARLVSDDPAKALDRRTRTDISRELARAMQRPEREIYLVSPYFVPTRTGTALLRQLAREGIDITVFTNSLHATDVAAVHSGYARYRRRLLEAGIELYELKAAQAVPKNKDKGLTGSSITSLHAKTFVFDKQRIFVGSLNLDPRSARLNTEMGLIISHPGLAAEIQDRLHALSSRSAYRVRLDKDGRIRWRDPQTGETLTREPDAKLWKRLLSDFLSVLPIERLL